MKILKGKTRDVGAFDVSRLIPQIGQKTIGPFVFFDHMGPAELGPGVGLDVRPHPHIGIATVTYLFEGSILHRDSLGFEQEIRPGDVNWMTAGRGIVHSERSPEDARRNKILMDGLQVWVGLPVEEEECEPAFYHHPADSLPHWKEQDASLRLILGEAMGHTSPVKTYSPILYIGGELPSGGRCKLPANLAKELGLYIVSGEAKIGDQLIEGQSLAILDVAEEIEIEASGERDLRFAVFGGSPFPEKRHLWWNLVSSRPERIEQAKKDWKENRFPKVPGDDESIPLPED